MKLLKLGTLCALLFGLVGCSLFSGPQDAPGQVYRLVVYNQDELAANDLAVYKAVSLCAEKDLQAKLLDHVSKYIGLNCEQKKLAVMAQKSFSNSAIKTTSDHDYRVTLRFMCVTPPLTGKEYCKYAKCRAEAIEKAEE